MQSTLLKQNLKKHFGYDTFRPLQEDIVNHVCSGKDSLVLMPTGGGKSICFQLPALTMPGMAIVVSPLIALMKDQVDALLQNGISAAYLNSSLSETERQNVLQKIATGKLDLLYVSPEKLLNAEIFEQLKQIKLSLFAIDEAHCVSDWGHDFRPEYKQLHHVKKHFPNIPIIALTATADETIKSDILEFLNLEKPAVFEWSFDRPNLFLEVRPGKDRNKQILRFINEKSDSSGIIYCLSRKQCEKTAQKLRTAGYNAMAYHAGMSSELRSDIQRKFVTDELPIVCATIAFGMGIDKSNVRWVIHYNLPKSMENYYQEIGRAGRDGLPSDTLLFYSYADLLQLRKFAEESANAEILLSKLQRMMDYAESRICRRRVLLNYFGEYSETDCKNCDVCLNPPKVFDGTLIAQKALSAVARTNESEAMGVLVDILKGTQNEYIFEQKYNTLKTFGCGKELTYQQWQLALLQLLQLGFVDVQYKKDHALKVTKLGLEVLKGRKKVALTSLTKEKAIRRDTKVKSDAQKSFDGLYEKLRALRLKLATEQNVPAYVIFSDVSLKEMANLAPTKDQEFLAISGVGETKLTRYGFEFMDLIRIHTGKKKSTQEQTLELYKKGLSIDEVCKIRGLKPVTIFSHLCKLYLDDEINDLDKFGSTAATKLVQDYLKRHGDFDGSLKPIFDFGQEIIPYQDIRIAITILMKKGLL
ncbi:MAG: DNA helicase RecQ [Flavobacteriales bacterium]